MNIRVEDGFERKNKALFKRHMRELHEDREKRERDSNAEIGDMAKSAGTWLHHRARGRKFFFT